MVWMVARVVIVSVANRRTRQYVVRGFDPLTIRFPKGVSFGVARELGSRVSPCHIPVPAFWVLQGMTSRVVATPLLSPYIASLAQLVRATDFKIGASVWKHAEWRRLYAGTPLEPSLLTTNWWK